MVAIGWSRAVGSLACPRRGDRGRAHRWSGAHSSQAASGRRVRTPRIALVFWTGERHPELQPVPTLYPQLPHPEGGREPVKSRSAPAVSFCTIGATRGSARRKRTRSSIFTASSIGASPSKTATSTPAGAPTKADGGVAPGTGTPIPSASRGACARSPTKPTDSACASIVWFELERVYKGTLIDREHS